MSYTPGPWSAGWSGDPESEGKDGAGPINIVALGRGGVAVCEPIKSSANHANTWDVVESNAALIAAAPDLLAALKALVAATEAADNPTDQGVSIWESVVEQARAVIKKAEGLSNG